jgi:O-antigen ligase
MAQRVTPIIRSLPVPLAIGTATAYAVLDGRTTHVLAGAVGAAFLALSLAHPRVALWTWLLFAPFADRYASLSLPVGLPDITFSRVVIAVVLVALLLRRVFLGETMRRLRPVEWAMGALVAIMGIDLFWRSDRLLPEALQNFDELGIPILLFVTARHFLTRRDDVKRVIYGLLFVGCSLAAHGVYQFWRFTGPLTPETFAVVERVGGARVNENFIAGGRAVGPFASPAEYGSVSAIVVAAAFVMLLRRFAGVPRALVVIALAASAAAVVLSATRSAWLAPAVAVAIVAALDRHRRIAILTSFAATLALVLAIVLLVIPRSDIFVDRAVSVEPIYARTMMYRIGVRLAARQLIVGYGRGEPTLRAAAREADALGGADAEIAAGQFHNTFLMTLVEWGVLGLASYVAVIALILRLAFSVRRLARNEDLLFHFTNFYVAAVMIFVLQNMLVDTPSFLYLNGLVFFLAGVLQAQYDRLVIDQQPFIAAPLTAAADA